MRALAVVALLACHHQVPATATKRAITIVTWGFTDHGLARLDLALDVDARVARLTDNTDATRTQTRSLAAAEVDRLWHLAEVIAAGPPPASERVTDFRMDLTITGGPKPFAITTHGPFEPGPARDLVDGLGQPFHSR